MATAKFKIFFKIMYEFNWNAESAAALVSTNKLVSDSRAHGEQIIDDTIADSSLLKTRCHTCKLGNRVVHPPPARTWLSQSLLKVCPIFNHSY